MTILPYVLLAASLTTAIPGVILILRNRPLLIAAGAGLLLTATASGYIGMRLMSAPPPLFIPAGGTGQFHTIAPEQLQDTLTATRGNMVMIDFHADWCPSCIRWEQEVFSQPDIRQALKPLVMLKVDATNMTPATQSLLDQYNLKGLPAILFLDREGREIRDLRLLGEMTAPAFRQWIIHHLHPRL